MLLSCWKEIAAYLHKGVRTTQRWERQMGLPVRRLTNSRYRVIAISEELDNWVQTRSHLRGELEEELLLLRARVLELEIENQRLRTTTGFVERQIPDKVRISA
jgi:hypothetical protein